MPGRSLKCKLTKGAPTSCSEPPFPSLSHRGIQFLLLRFTCPRPPFLRRLSLNRVQISRCLEASQCRLCAPSWGRGRQDPTGAQIIANSPQSIPVHPHTWDVEGTLSSQVTITSTHVSEPQDASKSNRHVLNTPKTNPEFKEVPFSIWHLCPFFLGVPKDTSLKRRSLHAWGPALCVRGTLTPFSRVHVL